MDEDSGGDALVRPVRVAVVGTGNVGATFAYGLLMSGLATEIVLINRDQAEAEGEAMDLTHAAPFVGPTRIWAGDYPDCAGAAITVLTAGATKGDAASRLDLVEQNGEIFKEIVPKVAEHNRHGILLVSSNPVDALTYATQKLSGLPARQVIGSGAILDTSRFRALLGQHFGIDPGNIHAYIIGEHGDSAVPVWSLANIAGMPLAAFAAAHGVPHDETTMADIFARTRDAGGDIADRKGATYYGVATGLMRIVEAILRDQRTILSVSSVVDGDAGIADVALSLPAIVGRNGIERVLNLDLSPEETEALRDSAGVLKEAQAKLPL